MIDRTGYLEEIAYRLRNAPIVALPGPRQVGKTTLIRQYVSSLPPDEVHYFDLELPSTLARLHNPELALSDLRGLVVLDEIQRVPSLFEVLRVLADRPDAPAKFLITGSASPDLVKGVSESLAGRVSFIDVSGLTLAEVGVENLAKRWFRGGFPRAYLAADDDFVISWHEDFVRTFLERDIPLLSIQVPAETLRRFWMMMAHYHGQTWNASEIGRSLGSNEKSAARYLDILCGTYMIRRLPPWFENLKKRQVKAPKVYLRDSGVCHSLLGIPDYHTLQVHPKLGASWEGFCIEQILAVTTSRRAYFWSTHSGAELDLLIFHKGKRLGFEFKFNEAPRPRKSMHIALQDLNLDHLYVVHPGRHSFPMTEKITAMTLPEILNLLNK